MRQRSLFDIGLAELMPGIRTAMRRVAADKEGEGRKLLVDRLNQIAAREGIKLTGGNEGQVSKATVDKWLSASDTSHPPSLLAVAAFCEATGSLEPLRVIAKVLGAEVMDDEDRKFRNLGKAEAELRLAKRRKRKAEEEL